MHMFMLSQHSDCYLTVNPMLFFVLMDHIISVFRLVLFGTLSPCFMLYIDNIH